MARGLNKATIIGHLGKDPEVRYTQGGATITNISIATTDKWTDKQSGETQERTERHRIVFFGRLAEIAGEYLKKGALIYVEGKIQTNKYTDKEGVERYSTQIVANEMQMLGGKGDGGAERQAEGRSPVTRDGGPSRPSDAHYFEDDDIPFD